MFVNSFKAHFPNYVLVDTKLSRVDVIKQLHLFNINQPFLAHFFYRFVIKVNCRD